MKKTVAAFLAVATIAGSLVSLTPAAQAGGGGVAAGVAAGIVGGAIVGGAIANSNPYYYGPGPAYYGPPPGGPGYYGPPPGPGCYWQQQRYWDGYQWNFHPVRVCY
jgi:hypothetical protein